jgi:hypothetical protein
MDIYDGQAELLDRTVGESRSTSLADVLSDQTMLELS